MADAPAPVGDDLRHDDLEFDPRLEPKKATAWLNLLEESEDAFEPWNNHCDKIDKLYADLTRLASVSRDKEFAMFWANMEVIKPSIYAKAPAPVVVPKFKDRRPVFQAASEVMERCTTVAFDLAHINDLMMAIRDDVVLIGRGVAWCRYESGKGDSHYDYEKVCIDYKDRRDFLHSVSRNWAEVTWVAAASYMTRAEARKRFRKHSGDCYQDAEYTVNRDSKEVGGADNRERAKFWEIWDKNSERCVWVAKGCEDILDEDDRHLELQDCFPCPKPAYGTLQRGSLVPVPDAMQYKDQLEELNLLTGRIHALSDALEVKGFYPAGGAEIADAVQAAIAIKTPGRLLVPINNWAAFGGSKEVIIWLPIDMIATTITALVAIRKQVIEDIYQITGLSDIMRGATDARETLGAQQLKSQFGSSRIRDKQMELVRIARDLVRITAEIITEKFDPVTIIEMSQTQLPTSQMVQQQVQQLTQQVGQQQQALQLMQQQIQQNPQAQQKVASDPDIQSKMQQLMQVVQSGQDAIAKIQAKPTIEQVLYLFQNNRAKAFVLDIETDSTVMVDENSEKERRAEFVGMLSQLLPQLAQMIATEPQTAPFCGEVLKFSVAPYRSGRTMDGAIDELVELMKQKGEQPRGDDPMTTQAKTAKEIEQMKIAHLKEKDQLDAQLKQAEMQMRDRHEAMKIQSNEKIKMADIMAKNRDDQAKTQRENAKAMIDREQHQMSLVETDAKMRADAQKAQLGMAAQQAKMADAAARADERRAMQQFKPIQGIPR